MIGEKINKGQEGGRTWFGERFVSHQLAESQKSWDKVNNGKEAERKPKWIDPLFNITPYRI
jgi:hypothetical protein